MKDTVRLGRIAGVRVGLNWSLVAMVVLVAGGLADNRFLLEAPGYPRLAYAAAGILTAGGLLLGVLLHELGHALVARRAGLGVDGITLNWMGGVTRIQGDADHPGTELVVAGIGPVVSAAFGGLLWGLRVVAPAVGAGRLAVSALAWLAAINLVLAVFNLVPAAPLDGGRVLHAVVWALTGHRWRATRVATSTGMALGALVLGVGVVMLARSANPLDGVFFSVIGWWLLASARAERELGALHHTLQGLTLGQIMRPVGAAPGWITVRSFAERYGSGRAGWVWLLETWGGGYGGVLLGDAIGWVPYPQWDLARPLDAAMPISAAVGAGPQEDVLSVMTRTDGKRVILVVDRDRTVGAVLPSDVEALVRQGRRSPVPSRGWTLTRG